MLSQLQRELALKQRGLCIWFTGLSGAGKSTLVSKLEPKLVQLGFHTMALDGDALRQGLNSDLGFTPEDRSENIRRTAEVSKLMTQAGLITLVGIISPFQRDRDYARNLIGESNFIEVFVDRSLGDCEKRDIKGLYAMARQGRIPQFTGIDSPYEVPLRPHLHLFTEALSVDECVKRLIDIVEIRQKI